MSDDFLDRARQAARSARTLQASGDPDGAVNRAFYAAHAALEHRGIEVASSKHGTLVRRFGEHLVKPGLVPRALGSSMSRTLERRHRADYGTERLAAADVEKAATEAEAFIAAVERLIRG